MNILIIKKLFHSEKRILKKSKFFLPEWYLFTYSDVAEAGVDPFEHYLQYGWKEGRDPGPNFSTNNYLEKNPDVKDAGINPLVHFEKYGYRENRIVGNKTQVICEGKTYLNHIFSYLSVQKKELQHKTLSLSITVIVPIYNGYEHVSKLLPTLVKNTPQNVTIIIIDDASTDEKIKEFIKLQKKNERIIVLENEINMGFVKTVNKAMSMVDSDIAVLLNSDTMVPPFWIERLIYPFEESELIAAATPFTNAAWLYAFPDVHNDNSLIFEVEQYDRVFSKITSMNTKQNKAFSANGFCMAINMKCWQKVGEFDSVFELGYGEEVDWCCRAKKMGYELRLIPNLFVPHYHGGSFDSETRKKMNESHNKILSERYPDEMRNNLSQFVKDDSWRFYRSLAKLLLLKNIVLIVDIGSISRTYNSIFDYITFLKNELNIDKDADILLVINNQNDTSWVVYSNIKSFGKICDLRDLNEISILIEKLPITTCFFNGITGLQSQRKKHVVNSSYVWD